MNSNSPSRKLIRPLVVAFAIAGMSAAALAPVSAASTAATCAATAASWGSLPKSLNRMTSAPITNAHAGRQACFDRLVVDLRGRGSGYSVRYVSQVRSEGQGAVVPLRGGARLSVVITALAYDINTRRSTYRPANRLALVNVAGFSTFRQIA